MRETTSKIENFEMINRNGDMDMLKFVIMHTAKDLYDITRDHSGYEIAANADEALEMISTMKRAAELLDDIYTSNSSLSV